MTLSYERTYRKTELGVAALKAHAGPLTVRSRTALILINGRDSLAVLAGKIGTEAIALVECLLRQRLIEEVPVASAEPRTKPTTRQMAGLALVENPATKPNDTADAAALSARLLPLKREALVRLEPQFGPDVDVICQPLLAAHTEQAYQDALAAIESKLAIYLGRKGAARALDGLRL